MHVTIAYHEVFREMVLNLEQWNRWFEQFPDLIFMGRTGEDVRRAQGRKSNSNFLRVSKSLLLLKTIWVLLKYATP